MNIELKQEFASENIWESINHISESLLHKKVASAYFGSAVDFKWNLGDILLLGLSEKNIANELIDIYKVKELVKRGIKVYRQENLHAKIYFNNEMAVVCSCNLSKASQHDWLEAGIITTDSKTLEHINNFFDDYATDNKLVTLETLEALESVKKKSDDKQNHQDVFKITEKVWVITTIPGEREDLITEAALTAKNNEAIAKIDEGKVTLVNIKLNDSNFFDIKAGDFVIRFAQNGSEKMLFPLYKCIQASQIKDELYYINLTQQKGVDSKKWKEVMHLFERFKLDNHNGEIIDNADNLIKNLLLLFSF